MVRVGHRIVRFAHLPTAGRERGGSCTGGRPPAVRVPGSGAAAEPLECPSLRGGAVYRAPIVIIVGVTLRAVQWQSYEPVDDGATVRIAATLGAPQPRRIDVRDGPDAVTITVYEDLPPGTTAIPLIGIGVRFEVLLPTPLARRPVIDGASGTERRDTAVEGAAVRVPRRRGLQLDGRRRQAVVGSKVLGPIARRKRGGSAPPYEA